MIEAVEHLLGHELASFLQGDDRPLDRGGHPRQSLLLGAQLVEVPAQRAQPVPVVVEQPPDVRKGHAKTAQHQDPLQADQCPVVVVPQTARTDPAARQHPDRLVVPQRAAGRAGHSCDLADRQLGAVHVSTSLDLTEARRSRYVNRNPSPG